jgi:hypothetical protein
MKPMREHTEKSSNNRCPLSMLRMTEEERCSHLQAIVGPTEAIKLYLPTAQKQHIHYQSALPLTGAFQ